MQMVASAKELCMALIQLAHPLVSCWSLLALASQYVLHRIVFGILSLEMWGVPSLKCRCSWMALRSGVNSLFQVKKVYDACKLAASEEAQEWDPGLTPGFAHVCSFDLRGAPRSTKR